MACLLTAIACYRRHVPSVSLRKHDSVAFHSGHAVGFLMTLEYVVGLLDGVRIYVQSVQITIPQVAEVWLVTCICSFYKLDR